MLRAIIMAGGFAKRMWPLTLDKPKQLLPLSDGYVVLDLVVDELLGIEPDEIVISTNRKFAGNFAGWARSRGLDNVRIEIEESTKEEEKPGAVAALAALIGKITEDEYFVVAGDNVTSLDYADMAAFYRRISSPVIAVYDVESPDLAKRYGIVDLSEDGRIRSMVEKPERPPSTLAATAIYLMPWRSLSRVREYLDSGGNRDAIGYFASWLAGHEPVYAYKFKGYWHDIGSIDEYDRVRDIFSKGSIARPRRVNVV